MYDDVSLSIASWAQGPHIRWSNTFYAALAGKLSAASHDVVHDEKQAGDWIRLGGVTHAARLILDEWLASRILAPASLVWMIIGH